MKKSKTFFACAMLAALASCSNDHVLSQQSPTPSDPDVINIVAASSKPATRAVENAANLQNTQFVENSEINVYLEEVKSESEKAVITYNPKVYKVTTTPGVENGSLVLNPSDNILPKFPSNEHGVLAYAFYPSTVSETENTATFTVELNQSQDVDYKRSDLMFGTNNYNTEAGENYGKQIENFEGTKKGNQVPLYFKHQLTKIIIDLDENSFDPSVFAGATISLHSAKKGCNYKAGKDGITEITATTDLGDGESYNLGTFSISNKYAGIIVPQDINKDQPFIKITTTDNPAKIYTYKIADDPKMTFEGGKKYIYKISLSGGNLVVVSVKIEDWDKVEKTGTADLEPSAGS